jgi:membrane protease YdiL (CAAX protease family)
MQGACQPSALSIRTGSLPAVAPLWHTRALVLLILLVAATGSVLGPRARMLAAPTSLLLGLYLPLLIVNLSLSLYVSRFGLERNIFWELFGARAGALSRPWGNLAWALGLAISVLSIEKLLQIVVGMPDSATAHALSAQSLPEKSCWLALAACVGFSEELVYRGYLQRQLAAQSGQLGLGIVLQAALFGIAHGEQGQWAVARFACYGILFGAVAAKQKTILPCVLAHATLDVYAGLSG